jgi:hypothetical protein
MLAIILKYFLPQRQYIFFFSVQRGTRKQKKRTEKEEQAYKERERERC